MKKRERPEPLRKKERKGNGKIEKGEKIMERKKQEKR